MNWSHPSLERAEYSVDRGRVMYGKVIRAYVRPRKAGGFRVTTTNGAVLGDADSPAHAMLMVVRQDERANG